MKYIKRIVDKEIDRKIGAFNAINIVGPKGCGKSRTAKERSKTIIEFQDEDNRDTYLEMASMTPSFFLKYEKPILFDEWQDAPKIWGTIRKDCDDNPSNFGAYYLTGSSSRRVNVPHTGTGRISTINMYPMSLYETGESNGSISLSELLDNDNYDMNGKISSLDINDLPYLMCRGGWPRCLEINDDNEKLEIAKDYYQQLCNSDVSNLLKRKVNPNIIKAILWAYARNTSTLSKRKTLYEDVKANYKISDATFDKYVEKLEELYVIKDIDAWTPQIRSKTAIRGSKKHIFLDPSIALAALNTGPDYFFKDYDLFGHVFENLVLRDLLVYADANGARINHYRDDLGLEVDAIYQAANGDYALIEIKLGANAIANAEKNLLKFVEVIKKHNQEVIKNKEHPGVLYREPKHLIFISATDKMSYTTSNGVKVIPIGCLKD